MSGEHAEAIFWVCWGIVAVLLLIAAALQAYAVIQERRDVEDELALEEAEDFLARREAKQRGYLTGNDW